MNIEVVVVVVFFFWVVIFDEFFVIIFIVFSGVFVVFFCEGECDEVEDVGKCVVDFLEDWVLFLFENDVFVGIDMVMNFFDGVLFIFFKGGWVVFFFDVFLVVVFI